MTTAATPQRTETSPPVRLAKGEIPQTWSRPAEQVSQVPVRAPRPLASGLIVVGGTAVGFLLALWLAPARTPPPPPPAAHAATPLPVSAIPTPPPTSSTRPSDVAPEDQGGDLPGVAAPAVAPVIAAPPGAVTTAAAPALATSAPDQTNETPARSKARKETGRAKALFTSGELVAAEAPLIRATLGDPTFAEGWRLLGAVRDALGNVDGAKRAYKRYLQLAPDAPDAPEVRAALASLAQAPPPAAAAPPPAPTAAPTAASTGN